MADMARLSGHNIIIEDRARVSITGVTAVNHYDETEVAVETAQGTLLLGGKNLKVSELSVDTGQVRVEGEIEYLQYTGHNAKKEGFFKSLLR